MERNCAFAKLLSEKMGVPVALTNDANAAAIGEATYGAARGMKDFVMITLGTGVGSGIYANGQLVYGHDGNAGELGHVIVRRGGRQCGCGNKGCLETYTSATRLRVQRVSSWSRTLHRIPCCVKYQQTKSHQRTCMMPRLRVTKWRRISSSLLARY